MPRAYVIFNGKNEGVYDSWAECKKYTGDSQVIYRGFDSKEAAEEALRAFQLSGRKGKDPLTPSSTPKKKKGKFYVLLSGDNVGLYENWEDIAPHVLGNSNVEYQSCMSWESAVQVYQNRYQKDADDRVTGASPSVCVSEDLPIEEKLRRALEERDEAREERDGAREERDRALAQRDLYRDILRGTEELTLDDQRCRGKW